MTEVRTDGSWLALVDVLDQLQLPADTPADSERGRRAERARLAAAAQVERVRPDLVVVDDTGAASFVGAGDVVEGALLLAARIYARQASPTGLASYGEFGPAAVLRFDPDVERLIGVGRYARPALG